ncbi:site-specific integrase, partial [Roseiconus lacunae]|nr:site-specific integrase [Roseiconus lacunae]
MPRTSSKAPPSYCLHRASGRAVVRIHGKDIYLGAYGSPESHDAYQRAIAQWRSATYHDEASKLERIHSAGFDLQVCEVIDAYLVFAATYYVKNGKPTKELQEMKYALQPLRMLYGDVLGRDFGPRKLKSVRQALIDSDLCRGVINKRIDRIKRFFKWAVAEELVPPSVHEGLRAVPGLKYGRTEAREAEPVKPVPDEYIDLVFPEVAPQVAVMIQLQRSTGMRPCETVMMRKED